jgi:hypothetical protein
MAIDEGLFRSHGSRVPAMANAVQTNRGNDADDGAAAESMRPSALAVPVA